MKTRITSKLFAGVLAACALTLGACAAFAKTNTYTDGQFKDVKTTSWYAKEVASAYELGFMNGTGADVFSPDGNVTVAQGITMAVRVHANFNGKEAPSNSTSGNWYDSFVKYAVDNGIIKAGDFDSYTRNITRAEMAVLFADAVPASEFKAINSVEHIPDVIESNDYASKILMLYNAGVVMGSDAYGTFNPDADIKRSEAAAIINRVAIPENRLQKTLKEYNVRDAYQFVYTAGAFTNGLTSNTASIRENIVSGWILDNRGGTARTSIEHAVTGVEDVSTTQGSAFIREFNRIDKDKIVAEFYAVVNGTGTYIEFRDEEGESAYQLKVIDGSWAILGKDGKYTTLVKAKQTEKEMFRLYLDFTTGKSETFIDGVSYGEHDLLSDNIVNFRFAIDEKGRGGIFPGGKINFVANYGVFEIFDIYGLDEVYGWKTEGNASVQKEELVLSGKASVTKPFDAIDTKYVAEMLAIFPEEENAGFKIMSGSTNAVKLESKNGKLYANGTEVYDLTKNMWYRLRVEANPSAAKAEIIVNGRTAGFVTLGTTNPVDTLSFVSENGNARFDNIKVYNLADHYDYVPEPSAKADLTDWIVAMNVCSLWRNNGTHYGWAVISPYDENKPVLGYYDEGNPESADWEIKFMAEHGIDAQAFCWYADVTSGPVKEPRLSYQLHDGYQQAKYEDYMKYCLIWEAGSGAKFNAQQFRENVIPYWFENYFLDENYLVIDNKPVLHVYAINTIASDAMFGTVEKTKVELDYLEEAAREHGFDGMIYVSNGTIATLAEVGIDANAAYHWGAEGYTYTTNVRKNLAGAAEAKKTGTVYQIPTISVGYSDYAWRNAKMPLMNPDEYTKTHKWVKDTYIPDNAKKGTWQEKMVWLSTWNEYGEGTYMMPCDGLHGFGYLDVIREEYTKLGEKHEDAVPSQAQLERINHLYPQYARHLRRQGYYKTFDTDNVEYESVKKITFEEGSVSYTGIENIKYENGAISGVSNVKDFSLGIKGIEGLDISEVERVVIKIKIDSGSNMKIYFGTMTEPNLDERKAITVVADTNEMKEYVFNVNTNIKWDGVLSTFRFDPADGIGINFTIESIDFVKESESSKLEKANQPELYVNGQKIESYIKYAKNGDDILFPFDPETAIQYIMHSLISWDHDEKALTIEANNHKVVYTVGKDTFTVDGVSKPLGYTLYATDGLPMISYKTLAGALGFTYKQDGNKQLVETPEAGLYADSVLKNRTAWEFEGFTSEGWSSGGADLMANGEYLKIDNTVKNHEDPNMTMSSLGKIPAAKYPKLEIRMRYDYTYSKGGETDIQIYFLTTLDKTWNESKKMSVKLNSTKSDEWEVYTIDMSKKASWFGDITAIRVDPFGGKGYAELDYIRLVEDPDYNEETAEDTSGIINGDAERPGLNTFTSPTATISVIEDETKPGNHVYFFKGKQMKAWTYAVHQYPFEAGKTYKISFDARAVSDSEGNKVDQVLSVNIQYASPSGQNHGAGDLKLPADGSWQHFEREYTVGDMLTTAGAAFSCYITPPSETTSGTFILDNVKVTEVK